MTLGQIKKLMRDVDRLWGTFDSGFRAG